MDILPCGDDAVVLRALLDLHVRTPLPRGRVVCTGDELRAATSFLVPDLQLTDEQVYFTLKRLLAAMVTVTQHGPGGGTVMFNFISDLEIDAHETADRFVLSRVTVSLPERTLRLGRAGAAPQG
ncbi:hypothetical protein [Deinococcus aetherius]|uniref:hypothetical protein n=1 Tax=Deinococcus aetherius TaxID=200252 RepID=UPI0031E7BA3E